MNITYQIQPVLVINTRWGRFLFPFHWSIADKEDAKAALDIAGLAIAELKK